MPDPMPLFEAYRAVHNMRCTQTGARTIGLTHEDETIILAQQQKRVRQWYVLSNSMDHYSSFIMALIEGYQSTGRLWEPEYNTLTGPVDYVKNVWRDWRSSRLTAHARSWVD